MPEWVFCSTSATLIDQHNAGKAFRRCLKKAGLPLGHSPYDLRHTFATLLLAKGKPITYVAPQLGHANPATTLTGMPTGCRPATRATWTRSTM